MVAAMRLLRPTVFCSKVTCITVEMLKALEVDTIFLDVDNTIASYTSKEPAAGVMEWLKNLQNSGFRVYIVSNNFKDRVSRISQKFGLPFISFAMKPLPIGFIKAKSITGSKGKRCLVVGDQVFTDVLGANLSGMKSVLTEPIEAEKSAGFKIRRHFEKYIRNSKEKTC